VTVLDLPPTADSVPRARRFVADELRHSPADVDTAVLLVSELVTNAVLHARTSVTVSVEDRRGTVRIEVYDGSPAQPHIHAYSTTSATGRGLRLLDRLARRWGVGNAPVGGKVIWFEVGAAEDTDWASFVDDIYSEGAGSDF
jgi:anti-sigma regulatory factor (Ser/Thr protein kinase)